jgi:hypothetical protein
MSTQPEEQQNPPQNPPENPPNPPADPPQNPPANPPQNPPAETAARTAQNATSQLLDARSLQELRTEIQALPERIVNGIREATQPPRAPTPQGSGSGNGGTPTGGAGNAPGQRKSFADWWFNS